MTAHDVREVLRRAQVDDDFFRQLQQDPEAALAGYDLSAAETQSIIRQDRSLYRYLVPSTSVVPERAISIVITITGEHDWFNVARLRSAESMSSEVYEQTTALARRVIGADGAERVEMLMTLLKLLDGREP